MLMLILVVSVVFRYSLYQFSCRYFGVLCVCWVFWRYGLSGLVLLVFGVCYLYFGGVLYG